ncbi:hypothetical protein LIER_24614 [Lithospermum erythrorhizon]|uniref:Protein odr-4 homolog n=1 Tax=Lithospermum erythrorhizon TaxID=34254 RepID=A0AAV3R4Y5_LITER
MVKSVIGEEKQLKAAEDRLSQSSVHSEVGLVIGKLSRSLDRGFVYHLIPSPPNESGEQACSIIEGESKKRGSSKSNSLCIDKDWIAEHARQVSTMLVGGVKVVGIYIWANQNAFQNSTLSLCQTVKGVAEAATFSETFDHRLLIHVSYSPRRWTCWNCSLGSNITSGSLRPCDFKMGRVLTALQTFRCTYGIDLRFPICREAGSNIKKLSDILSIGISSHAKELKGSKVLIDGNLVIDDEQSLSNNIHDVEILLPFMQDRFAEACSDKEVVGVLTLSGAISSFAYLNQKEVISQAVADIKDDIIRSLQSRLDILSDEAEREADIGTEDGGDHQTTNEKPVPQLLLQLERKNCSLLFPRRVFVPWLGGINICDYIQPSETIEVIKYHCIELMSMQTPPDSSTISEPEIEALTLRSSNGSTFWDIAIPGSSASINMKSDSRNNKSAGNTAANKKATKSLDISMIIAALVLFISILLGLFLFVFQ